MTDYQDESNALIPNTADEEPMSMTLSGIGRSGGEAIHSENGYDTEAGGGGGLLSHTTLLVVVVAIVAAGSLYLMRASQGSLASSKDVQDIEAKIATTLDRLNKPSLLPNGDPLLAENLSALLAPTEDITAIFAHDVREQQVPIEQVKKDPFSLAFGTDPGDAGAQDSAKDNDRRLAKLNDELKKFDLQSIMAGTRNIAVIGGEFYKKGDRLGSFTVTDMDKLTVYLDAGGTPFELTLRDQKR